ncbi:MAG TPA: YaeQ family protein [Arenimonas sp.]|uniref:YaeQ family protein n=1 Tax=Arenimonas sp. TaxID=1872635 RepID=UPI002D7F40E0|nr:YaeQ family protein [Arenimonas sp.]HEU0151746.1 YaeQ family protein [Arenimonas sp.]
MAPKSTVYKAQLQVSDMDRHYYASHDLVLAQHPSETDERLMLRLLAFALFADERLEFGRGLSTEDEPDLWRKDLTGQVEQWIELGQPDESRVRKACGRAGEVVVLTYGGRGADLWWEKNEAALARCRNLTVLDVSPEDAKALAGRLRRGMDLQAMVQDGVLQLVDGDVTLEISPRLRRGPG